MIIPVVRNVGIKEPFITEDLGCLVMEVKSRSLELLWFGITDDVLEGCFMNGEPLGLRRTVTIGAGASILATPRVQFQLRAIPGPAAASLEVQVLSLAATVLVA